MTDLDRETSAAVDALANRLRNRDPEVDAEVFAREFMTALRGRGWRPTEARVAPNWQRPAPHASEPPTEWREAREALAAQLAERKPEDAT